MLLRLGIVIADGGALGKMLTPFKLGLGGPVGSGKQFWSWISIGDVCGIVGHALENSAISGPVNAVASQEVTSSEFARTLGGVLSRPAFIPMPAFAAKLALGEMAESLLLASQRVRPGVLESQGYAFASRTLEHAIRSAIE